MSSSGYSNPPPPQSSNPVPHPSPPPLSAPEPPAFRDDPYADGAPSPVVKEALTLCGQIGSGDDPIWTLLALSTFLESWAVIHSSLTPSPVIGIYIHIAQRMLRDVCIFVTVLGFFVLTFYTSM